MLESCVSVQLKKLLECCQLIVYGAPISHNIKVPKKIIIYSKLIHYFA